MSTVKAQDAQTAAKTTAKTTANTAAEEAAELVATLRSHLDGPHSAVRDACRRLAAANVLPPDHPLPTDEYRVRVTAQLLALAREPFPALGFPAEQGGGGRYADSVAGLEMLGHGDLSLFVKAGTQWGLFGGAVSLLGTERHAHLVPRIISGDLLGCFAMTETGHGSDVQRLGTTATYDADTDELVVHTPSPAARKDYIGNAAVDGRMAAVFAQLVVAGQGRGVHCVLVPIRHDNGGRITGVTIEDCGSKLGLAGVDNGRLTFDNVRVPRTSLLGRFGDIGTDGSYASPIESPAARFYTMLGTLVRGRVSVAGGAAAAARTALALAVRYSAQRTQFSPPDSSTETVLLDYRTHQRRLLPRLASAYALQFAQHALLSALDDSLSGRLTDEQERRRLETTAAALKVFATQHATATVQECREACGGAGYLWSNRLAALKADSDMFTTFEGDNTVLLQLVSKSLLGEYEEEFGDLDQAGIIRLGARRAAGSVLERTAARGIAQRLIDSAPGREEDLAFAVRGTQLRLVRDREQHLLESVARRLRRATETEANAFEAFNATQDHLVATATAHVERLVVEAFAEAVDTCPPGPAQDLLARLCDLHALATIERHKAWYLEHDRLSPARTKALTARVNDLCAEIRPQALTLVDAFGIPEAWLRAEMLRPQPLSRS